MKALELVQQILYHSDNPTLLIPVGEERQYEEVETVIFSGGALILVPAPKADEKKRTLPLRPRIRCCGNIHFCLPTIREVLAALERDDNKSHLIGVCRAPTPEAEHWWKELTDCLLLLLPGGAVHRDYLWWPTTGLTLQWFRENRSYGGLMCQELFFVPEELP